MSVLVKAFNDLGYVEGRNIHLDHRFPAENPERFRTLAQELIDAKPDAIIAVNPSGAVALKKLTSTIPIVFVLVPDPIGSGLVDSLARPGGNATGLSSMMVDLSGKRLELLKEAVPNLSRVALLLDPTSTVKERTINANQTAAEALGISLWPAEISAPDDIEPNLHIVRSRAAPTNLRLFATGAATAHPIGSTNGRVIPGVAKVGASLSDNFFAKLTGINPAGSQSLASNAYYRG